MKKYAFLLMVMTLGLLSCGDDDKPVIPQLNKLTKIVCYKNGNAEADAVFSVNINYTNDGDISSMQFANGQKAIFVYVDRKFTVTNIGESNERAEYIMTGNVIGEKYIQKDNPYMNNEVYRSDEYVYKYSGSNLTGASRVMRWPKEGETGYETQAFDKEEAYSWENGNVTLFTQEKKRIEYKYSTALASRNFPWRVIPSFNPVGFEAVSPINLLYGNLNRNLPESAHCYNISGEDNATADYSYQFTSTGEYITSMTIREKINPANGVPQENSYEYIFTYNYVADK